MNLAFVVVKNFDRGGGIEKYTREVATRLVRKGHDVTVFEALPEPGGMAAVGIPDYRLPRPVLGREVDMVKAAGGWAASLSASVRPVVTYWVLFVWSFIHVWFAWNAWLAGALPIEVFKTMMTPDFSALLAGTINFWFLDRTLAKRGL